MLAIRLAMELNRRAEAESERVALSGAAQRPVPT
jgi:hypothetical protein